LLDEQRIALGTCRDLLAGGGRELGVGEQRVDERGRVLFAQRFELDNARAGPVGPGVEELRSCGADEEDRPPREADEVLDEV